MRGRGDEKKGRRDPALSALAVPTASEAATAMEAATHGMGAETSEMGDTHTVRETATAEMGGAKAAIHTYGATNAMTETASHDAMPKAGMGKTYTVIAEITGCAMLETVTFKVS